LIQRLTRLITAASIRQPSYRWN